MKSQFSTSWVSSVQPRKQRKYRYEAPLHVRHKFLSAHLSKELRKKYSKRSLPLRVGDEVLVMRGFFKKKKAKVFVPMDPSVIQILTLTLDDKKRLDILEKKTIKSILKEKSIKIENKSNTK